MATTPAPSAITSRAPLVEFTKRFVQPPAGLYITQDDLFRIEFTSSFVPATMEFAARILEPNGTVVYYRQRVRTTATRAPVAAAFDGIEGFLLGFLCVLVVGSGEDEWNYASVGLSRGNASVTRVFQVLVNGYFDLATPLFWPGGPSRGPTQGTGILRQLNASNPAAGGEVIQLVPESTLWRLVGLEVSLVTDANAANRRFILEARRSTIVLFAAAASVVQTASTTFRYSVGHWGTDSGNLDGRVAVNWPDHVLLSAGDVMTTVVANLQAGDDFGVPSFFVEEWFQRR